MADSGGDFVFTFPRREFIIPDGVVLMRGPLKLKPGAFDPEDSEDG